ncbi:MAG: class IV adenylate cyclase [Treponema sp.]|jgi:adenylate cyclase class 2|nr:class IV adenylate cyclase [Treponema sp.]
MTEIELKARVENPERLKTRLEALAVYRGAFEKEDAYWFPQKPAPAIPPSGIRVRREKDVSPGGESSVIIHVTYKAKEVRKGIEINDEREFDVSQAKEFEDLIGLLGCEKGISKKKKGWAYSRGRINAELCEVEGLGWFIELEILSDKKDGETLDGAGKELLLFLGDLGIGEEALESRYYTEMLRATDS